MTLAPASAGKMPVMVFSCPDWASTTLLSP
jgi:hypothetical protein